MAQRYAPEKFSEAKLKMIRRYLPERWADAARGPTTRSVPMKTRRPHAMRSTTSRDALARLHAGIHEEKFLHERIQTFMESQGKQLPQKPITPSYQELLSKREAMDRELKELRDNLQFEDSEGEGEFPRLTDDQEDLIDETLQGPRKQVVISCFNVDLTRESIATLSPGAWLDDEIINIYGQLIMERAHADQENFLKVHFFNTHFYPFLSKGFAQVKRWTRKIDIFSMDCVLIPIHLGVHWTCGIINLREKRFEFYDSLGGPGAVHIRLMRHYLEEESLNRKKVPIDLSSWTDYTPNPSTGECPAQMNGYDCGVFTCFFMEYASRAAPFDYGMDQMPYFRRRIILEIMEQRLLPASC
ncbi:SUMO1 sentrin specific peptidase 1 [Thoreauomyces humboldtii]|nr:SUMO1 sentrin specific peptidase 1 [Thoreauomyces humboldtii]